MGIADKLILVSGAVRYIKNDRAHGMGFNYVTSAAIVARVNVALAGNGLAVVGSAVKVLSFEAQPKGGSVASVHVRKTLRDAESKEEATFEGVGGDADPVGPKALAKAETMATRYLYINALNIAHGDEDEDESVTEAMVATMNLALASARDAGAVVDLWVGYRPMLEAWPKALKAGQKAVLGAVKRFGRDQEWLVDAVRERAE